MANTTMTPEERREFLSLPLTAVISIPEPGRGPLAVPVWFYFDANGDICIWTGSQSRKGRLLRAAQRISVCVQEPRPPYKYVCAEGHFNLEPVQYERDVRPMALRYFGEQEGEKFLASIGGAGGVAGDLLVRLHPDHWLSVDYTKELAVS